MVFSNIPVDCRMFVWSKSLSSLVNSNSRSHPIFVKLRLKRLAMAETRLIIYRVFLCFFLCFLVLTQSAPQTALITKIPGITDTLPSKHYSGYFLFCFFIKFSDHVFPIFWEFASSTKWSLFLFIFGFFHINDLESLLVFFFCILFMWVFEGMWRLIKFMVRICFTISWNPKGTQRRIRWFYGLMVDQVVPASTALYTSTVSFQFHCWTFRSFFVLPFRGIIVFGVPYVLCFLLFCLIC